MIPFVRDLDFEYGRVDRLTPRIRRVIAPNPGPFTYTGTGTYLIGGDGPGDKIAVVDPGPLDDSHLAALVRAVDGQRVTQVLVTHTHRDHSPLARPFATAVGAPVLAARPPTRGAGALDAPDEADDLSFSPDRILTDGGRIAGDGWTLETVGTPGHASNHLAFALLEENALFCGDHVMGWSTTVVAPPDGDMTAYMSSLETVIARDYDVLWPTHGAPIPKPRAFLEAYRAHRLGREAQIMARLRAGDRRVDELVAALYADIDRKLWPAAGLSVWAHLISLVRTGAATAEPAASLDGIYRPA